MKNTGSFVLITILALASQGCSRALAAGSDSPTAAQEQAAAAHAVEVRRVPGAARESGLDLARFETDRSAAPMAPSEQLADHLGVTGTPTFKDDGPGCAADCKEGDDDTAIGDAVEVVPVDGAPVRGPQRASITIVAFGDFQCPYSAKGEASLRAVEQAHPNDVKIVFKNLPLPMHDQARLAARAAIAADAQGHFWEFHDKVFALTGSSIDRAALGKIAGDLGLDAARFSRDIDDPATAARVARDEADADTLEVRGTPTFFVNGHRVVGAQPASAFEAAIAKSR